MPPWTLDAPLSPHPTLILGQIFPLLSLSQRAVCPHGVGLLLALGLMACSSLPPNSPSAASGSVPFAFWNLENLFDADDDPDNEGDDEYLPANEWTQERYALKIGHLAEAIDALDVDVLGVCEVENRRTLEDLVSHAAIAARGYQIAHLDSPDLRGIDLALLVAAPLGITGDPVLHPIDLGEGVRPTRGVLEVQLQIQSRPLTVLVNHWPSRYGGREVSAPRREMAATVVRALIDGHMRTAAQDGREAEVLVMGDFNDDPFDASVHDVLGAVRERRTVAHPYNLLTQNDKQTSPRLYNPTWSLFAEGDHGTYYYWNDWTWNVFDQIIVSPGRLDGQGLDYVEGSVRAHAPDFLRDTEKNAQRPARFRKFRGTWEEGYSDHFAIRGELSWN